LKLAEASIQELADRLHRAELEAREIDQISTAHPDMDLDDAYAVQHALRARKVALGARIVGLKAGLTSRAKMTQMGVDQPSYGFLADYFAVPDGGEIDIRKLIHPRVEPEIAFVTSAPLKGPGCHFGAVMAATDFICPAIEVIDSRYRNFKFDMRSVVADNSSSSRFVVGGLARAVADVDVRTLGVVLEKNGIPVAFGAAAAVLGHPAASVALLANMLARRGEVIPAGSLVLTGGVTEAVAVEAGDAITVRVQSLGSVSLRFVKE
jgi:2-oxo-3-hexenedioate decarboxylase